MVFSFLCPVVPAHIPATVVSTILYGNHLYTLPPQEMQPLLEVREQGLVISLSLFTKKCFQKWNENINWEVLWGMKSKLIKVTLGSEKHFWSCSFLDVCIYIECYIYVLYMYVYDT